jgi:DNA-binding beta-propeller fold protein YncE
VAVSPNGQRVYIANFDNALKQGSLKVASTNNDITESVPIGKGSWGVTVGPDGKRVYVSRFATTRFPCSNTRSRSSPPEICRTRSGRRSAARRSAVPAAAAHRSSRRIWASPSRTALSAAQLRRML